MKTDTTVFTVTKLLWLKNSRMFFKYLECCNMMQKCLLNEKNSQNGLGTCDNIKVVLLLSW